MRLRYAFRRCSEFSQSLTVSPTTTMTFRNNMLQYRTSINLIRSGTNGLQKLLGPYLNATDYATDTCGRTCFQHYQNTTHDFYANCRSQLNATYVPLATAISNFQEYRNQACCKFPPHD